MGIGAALFTLLIAFTGILLNHTEDFRFSDSHVQSAWILDWYGIEAPDQLLSYPVGERRITLMGDDLYLDRREIGDDYHDLTGAIQLGNMLVVSINGNILLLTPRGEVIERLKSNLSCAQAMKPTRRTVTLSTGSDSTAATGISAGQPPRHWNHA